MILNSDIMLYHPLWEQADRELCGNEGISLFVRLVDLFILACSIGIKEDKRIVEFEDIESDSSTTKKSIGRNTYMSMNNTNLRELLDFMLQNAILYSKTIDFDIEERLKLAFDPDYNVPKFSAASFLIGFANYGLEKIYEKINSKSAVVVIDELHRFLEDMSETNVDELLKNFTLDELIEDALEGI